MQMILFCSEFCDVGDPSRLVLKIRFWFLVALAVDVCCYSTATVRPAAGVTGGLMLIVV